MEIDHQKKQRKIIHLDMDAFYPSVEVLDNPSLKGKPVIVGGGKERGVVSSASYEARIYGVHSAQPIAKAMRLCPEGIYLPVRMHRYRDISRQVFAIFGRFTPLVEPLSIDEAFLDVSGSVRLFGSPAEIAKMIKKTVFKEIGLTISAGVGPSKFIAKIASDLEKPDGLTVVGSDHLEEFLDPLPVTKMWGVGEVTRKKLNLMKINTFKDLRLAPLEILEKKFGKSGLRMHQLASGIDEREILPECNPKSIGREETFIKDILEIEKGKKELLSLTNKVGRRLRRAGLRGRTITLKVKYSDFMQVSRSTTLSVPTDDGLEIYSKVCGLLKETGIGIRPVRLLGVSISNFDIHYEQKQVSLFEETSHSKRRQLNKAVDSLIEKHGNKSIIPGSLLSE